MALEEIIACKKRHNRVKYLTEAIMKIGIITAMADETTPLYQKIGKATGEIKVAGVTVFKYEIDGNEIFLVRSGVGEIRAAMTFQLLVDRFGVEIVLNFGFVGSLDNRFDVGDIVLAEKVVHYQFDTSAIDNVPTGQYDGNDSIYFNTDKMLLDKVQNELSKPLPQVVVASGDKFIASRDDKEFLRSLGAQICEMECAGLVIASLRNEVPLLSIKVISDKADESAEVSFGEVVKKGLTRYEEIFPLVLKAVCSK